MITPTPRGARFSSSQSAICAVSRSCTWSAAREQVDDPAELGEADDSLAGQVADLSGAVERQQVVGAQRLEGNVADHDQLVVALVVGEGGGVEGPGVSSSA